MEPTDLATCAGAESSDLIGSSGTSGSVPSAGSESADWESSGSDPSAGVEVFPSLDAAGSSSVLEVWAPPELCTIPARGSPVGSSVLVFFVGDSILAMSGGDAGLWSSVDEESALAGDSLAAEESDGGSANATPGVVTTAVPMPSATASAPTRPMNVALPILAPPSTRLAIANRPARKAKFAPAVRLG